MAFDPYSILPPFGWLFVAIAAVSLHWLLAKNLITKKVNDTAISFLNPLLSTLFFIPAVFLLGADFGFSGGNWLQWQNPGFAIAIISGLIWAASMLFNYKSLKHIDVSDSMVISQARIIFVLFISWTLLSEILTIEKLFAAFLIFAGTALCSYKYHKLKLQFSGVLYAVFGAAFSAAAYVLDKMAIAHVPILIFAIASSIPVMLGIFLWDRTALQNAKKAVLAFPKEFLAFGILLAISYTSLLLALNMLEASVAVPIYGTRVVLISLGGILLLREKTQWILKILGAILAFAGVVLIS
ncbi:hypothetical protein COU37_05305 [Candidatus Micrarchaeota archaeon CG10_big_fil_rev_8_21_14_0_10_45_29]|nr:MAG: hypothetical protein COU37_05305 [Candidatus Micrarchaeota archaeon CG10_big_fil_rev_8_21_14_0_10_45_29]